MCLQSLDVDLFDEHLTTVSGSERVQPESLAFYKDYSAHVPLK